MSDGAFVRYVYGFVLEYLHELATRGHRRADEARQMQLVLGGYSYGSLIASHAPPLDVMMNLLAPVCSCRHLPWPD